MIVNLSGRGDKDLATVMAASDAATQSMEKNGKGRA